MTDTKSYLSNNLSLASKRAQVHSLLKSGVSSVFEDKFESAAGCFEALLILVEADVNKLDYSSETLFSWKFALCCCYFYADTENQRNLQLLKEIQQFEDQIPAVHYMSACILYKLNVPTLALKNIEYGLYSLSKYSHTKLYFWPETNVKIDLTEKTYLTRKFEDLKEKVQSSFPFTPSPSENGLDTLSNSILNVTAPEFYPVKNETTLPRFSMKDGATQVIDELHQHYELLQKIYFEQSQCKILQDKMEIQFTDYDKKIKELEQKLEEKDKLIAILSNKDKLTWDTSEKLLNSIKSFISQQNKIEVEKISAENMKLRGIIAQLTEKYFNIQFGLSKTNEEHCLTTLKNLNLLLKCQSMYSFLNSSEINGEINVWKIKLDKVQKHRNAIQNALILTRGNTSEDILKHLNGLTEDCSCVVNKPDLLQQICLKNILKCTKESGDDHVITYGGGGSKSDCANDWKYHLRKHRVTSLGLNTDTVANEETTNKCAKKVSFIAEDNLDEQEKWIKQEISKLSERVKLIGGPNYWRLIIFIKDKFPMESEDFIVDAVEMVRASHGKLNGLSRDKIFNEVQMIIQTKKGAKKILSPNTNTNNKSDSNKCTVCLEAYNFNSSAILTCGHRFHKSCIQAWLSKEPLCPICRAFIVPQEYNTLKLMR